MLSYAPLWSSWVTAADLDALCGPFILLILLGRGIVMTVWVSTPIWIHVRVVLLALVCSCMWGYWHMYVHACGATFTCMFMHVGLLAHVCSCMWGYLHMYVHACGATCTCMSRCIEFRSLMLGSSTVVLPFVYWVRAFSEPRACLNILARLPVLMLIQHPLDPNHQPPARPHSCVAVVILRTNLMLVQHTSLILPAICPTPSLCFYCYSQRQSQPWVSVFHL
jgi:hypothetical protein